MILVRSFSRKSTQMLLCCKDQNYPVIELCGQPTADMEIKKMIYYLFIYFFSCTRRLRVRLMK